MPLEPRTCLGPYEILSPIGAGGMGEVYRARDHRLERDVAVKVLPTDFTPGSRQLEQFEHEAKLLASLNHPSICAIYDVGSERGVSFMVMEHLRGETLAARIDRGSISASVALRYALQIAEALQAAHGAGLVHRDIKPANIMLTTMGVKLLDFGLAKRHMAPAAPTSISGVATGIVDTGPMEGIVGTLHYMAPEQLAGGLVDARSDIWAFGCVIYEMVAGRRAFSGKTMTEVIAAIVTDRPRVMTIEHGVAPIALEHLVSRCLARDPAERWQSIAELAVELRSMLPHAKQDAKAERAVAGSTGTTAPPPAASREAALSPRHTRKWIVAAAAAIAVGGPAAWFVGRALAPSPAPVVAVLPFAGAPADLDYLNAGLADGLVVGFARLPQVHMVPWAVALHYDGSDPQKAGRALGADRIVTGRVTARSGRIDVAATLVDVNSGSELWHETFSEPAAEAPTLQRELTAGVARALRVAPASTDVPLPTLPAQLSGDAYRLLLLGRAASNRRDERSLRGAIGFFTDAAAKDARLASAFAGVAECYRALAHFTIEAMRPSEALASAKAAATKALELDPSLADAHAASGFVKSLDDRDWPAAGIEYARAVSLQPDDPAPRQWRSEWLMDVGRPEEALAEARTATRLDPLSAGAGVNLGWQLFLARKYSEGIEQLKGAIRLNPNAAAAHWALGLTYVEAGQSADGVTELKAATAIAPGRPLYLAGLAYANARAKQTAEATQLVARVRAMSAREYVSPFDLALVSLALDDSKASFDLLQQAVDTHASATASLAVDPRLDPLRADPRFTDLLKRTGLQR